MSSVNGINLAIRRKNENGYVEKDYFDTLLLLWGFLLLAHHVIVQERKR